ncbi:prepilin-type N-terminal cleavage/methylation domain-containing protein [Campylobacter estrildidarum]|uniref:Transformation system protein n=1 Tax=Campylobacter estrildidarum TaxID=2510189 RepID=A0A4V6DWG1_9BACT|nr:prepilin-type N-terminal cleavage/methylation domain-containing protein [Campylobacter estrildidarum]TKX31732.1 transformation system protein [Campylobacter estrildidarum]
MKNAFSLLELVISMIILGIIFIGISKLFLYFYKNYNNLDLFKQLYQLQNELYIHPKEKDIILYTQLLKPINIKEVYVSDGLFEFKKLYIQDQSYNIYFYEQSF